MNIRQITAKSTFFLLHLAIGLFQIPGNSLFLHFNEILQVSSNQTKSHRQLKKQKKARYLSALVFVSNHLKRQQLQVWRWWQESWQQPEIPLLLHTQKIPWMLGMLKKKSHAGKSSESNCFLALLFIGFYPSSSKTFTTIKKRLAWILTTSICVTSVVGKQWDAWCAPVETWKSL